MTTVTTDKYVSGRSDRVVEDNDGILHYSVLVENVPGEVLKRMDWLPPVFCVKMCELIVAYDNAGSWLDFKYPAWMVLPDLERDGVPTCIACSSA